MEMYIRDGMRKWWYLPFLVYLLPNILMALFAVTFNLLIVDNISIFLTATTFQVFAAILLVTLSFYYVRYLSLKFSKIALNYKKTSPSKYLGIIIFIFQVLQLATLLIFDYGRVGGVSSSSNIVVVIMSYLPSDILFLVYYGHQRNKGVPWLNLSLYLITAVLQGWSGIWLLLFFIEFFYMLKKKPFKSAAKLGILITIGLVVLYPLISKYKSVLRGSEDVETGTALQSGGELLIRLQHVANVILIYQEQQQIEGALSNDEILPYYLDNRIGGTFFYSSQRVSIQKYLTTSYLIDRAAFNSNTDTDEFGWFTHVGIASWFLILGPFQIIIYMFFIVLITSIPFLINHLFIKSIDIIPVLQTLTIAYAFHGWLSVQVSFIWGVMMYVVICHIFKRNRRKSALIADQ